MSIVADIGMDTTSGQLKITSAADTSSIPSIIGSSGTPIVVAGAALGTGASNPTIVGNNIAGKITFATATLSVVSGIAFTMTFANSLSYPTGCFVTLTAGNSNCAGVIATLSCTTTQTTAVLNVAVGLGVTTTYIGYYQIVGY